MSAKKDHTVREGADRTRLSVTDYERMADDYAATPVRETEVVGRWRSV